MSSSSVGSCLVSHSRSCQVEVMKLYSKEIKPSPLVASDTADTISVTRSLVAPDTAHLLQ